MMIKTESPLAPTLTLPNHHGRQHVGASDLDGCARQTAYRRAQPDQQTNQFGAAGVGTLLHEALATRQHDAYETEVPVIFGLAGVRDGHADYVGLDDVGDLKTVGTLDYVQAGPKHGHILQTSAYALTLKKTRCWITYLNRIDGETLTWEFAPDPSAIDQLKELEKLTRTVGWPDPIARPYWAKTPDAGLCSVCPFVAQCWTDGEAEPVPLPDPIIFAAAEEYLAAREAEKIAKDAKARAGAKLAGQELHGAIEVFTRPDLTTTTVDVAAMTEMYGEALVTKEIKRKGALVVQRNKTKYKV